MTELGRPSTATIAGADTTILALCVWREARNQKLDAQVGVAFSILNRVQKPSWWGNDVLSVVFKKWQFSSFTDPHDRQLTTWPAPTADSWLTALAVAEQALAGVVANPVPHADSYYDDSIAPPEWATPERFVAAIGALRFFNVDADHEFPAG